MIYHPQWCFISINSVDTRYLNSLQKYPFYSMAIVLSYFVPYMLIIIIVVSTSLNEQ